jgi:hypothetical protein
MREAPKWYGDSGDRPPCPKASAEVRRIGVHEGWCFQHVQAISVAIDQYAEAATGNREFSGTSHVPLPFFNSESQQNQILMDIEPRSRYAFSEAAEWFGCWQLRLPWLQTSPKRQRSEFTSNVDRGTTDALINTIAKARGIENYPPVA